MNLSKTQKNKRFAMMVSGAFAIFFTGYPHVWSIYQPYVMEQTGWSQGQASMCFYLALCTFVFGNIIGGRIQDKYNPRLTVIIGGGIFAAGIFASAFFIVPSPLPVYLTYGVMQGLGQGMIYTTIISTAQRWFPGRTGFASGIIVTANGLCGFFLAPLSRQLLEAVGLKGTFLVIGTAITASWILSSIFFSAPDAEVYQKEKESGHLTGKIVTVKQYTSAEMMRTKSFYLLLATMLLGLISYFMLSPVSQTYQIEMGVPSAVAVSAVMLGSIANAGTRLVLPMLADKAGRVVCIKGVLVVAILAMGILSFGNSYAITAAVILMYACYGGVMGSFPSFTSSIFGIKHSGENYGYVMFGIVIATFGAPAVTEFVSGQGFGMKTVFMIGMISAAAAFVCLTVLGKILNCGGEYNHGIGKNENIIRAGGE